MLFEDVLLLMAALIIIFLIGIPVFKLVKSLIPQHKDPVKAAKVRLDVAKQELEAARLNKETEKLYTEMYKEVLEDDTFEKDKGKEKHE